MRLQYSSVDDIKKQINKELIRRSYKVHKLKLWKSISQDVCIS